jgi:DeoR family glycerol-3-phosphate regulon repressor
VQVSQAIIANARSVVLVADGTKLRRSAPVRIAHISQIQTFVTDAALPADLDAICQAQGIEVIVAMPGKPEELDGAEAEPVADGRPRAVG